MTCNENSTNNINTISKYAISESGESGGTPTSTIEAAEDIDCRNLPQTWRKISLLICIFVIFREFHPIESYFVKYLETINPNYTPTVIKQSVYPIGTYASLLLLIVTFLITDYLRYKPIVILDVAAGFFCYVLLINNPSLPVLWVSQVCIGFYHAGEVSYYSYMYSKIQDKSQYQIATGRVKSCLMIGRFISGIYGQIVVSIFATDGYKYLLYLSIIGMTGAVLWTFLLPPVETSVYFHRHDNHETNESVFKIIYIDFVEAFSNFQILKWSLWWVLGMAGYIVANTYNQLLWSTLNKEDPEKNMLFNGAVDAIFTIMGAISTYSIGKLALDWNRYGALMICFGSTIQGIVLILSHFGRSLNLVYLNYIVFGCIHYTMLTIASSEIAKYLKRESFALVFGFNKFVALASISVFTLVVVQIKNTKVRTLYLMFGCYFLTIGFTYLIIFIYIQFKKQNKPLAQQVTQSSYL